MHVVGELAQSDMYIALATILVGTMQCFVTIFVAALAGRTRAWQIGDVCTGVDYATSGTPAKDMLRGKHLRAVEIDFKPYGIKDSSAPHGFRGLDMLLLEEVASELGFTYEVHDAEAGLGRVWKDPPYSLTWTNLLLDRNGPAGMLNVDDGDMFLSYWLPDHGRRVNSILPMHGHLDGSVVLVARREAAAEVDAANIWDPERLFEFANLVFTPALWGVLFAVILVSGLVLWFVEKDFVKDNNFNPFRALYEISAAALGGGFTVSATAAAKMYTLVLALFFMIVLSLYTATLAAAIASRATHVMSATSLAAVREQQLTLCEPQGGAWNERFQEAYRDITTRTVAADGVTSLGIDSAAALLHARKCDAVVATRQNYMTWRKNSSYCQFRVTETLYPSTSGWVTNRHSLCVALAVNSALATMEADGRLDALVSRTFRAESCNARGGQQMDTLESTQTSAGTSSGSSRRRLTASQGGAGGGNAAEEAAGTDPASTRWDVADILGLLLLWLIASLLVVAPTVVRKLRRLARRIAGSKRFASATAAVAENVRRPRPMRKFKSSPANVGAPPAFSRPAAQAGDGLEGQAAYDAAPLPAPASDQHDRYDV